MTEEENLRSWAPILETLPAPPIGGLDWGKTCPRDVDQVFRAFRVTRADECRVVLLGMDPYPNPTNACGLSFSVPRGRPIPASLRTIFSNIVGHGLARAEDFPHGDLTRWASQGMLLLNRTLTCPDHKSGGHEARWSDWGAALIKTLGEKMPHLNWIALGRAAQGVLDANLPDEVRRDRVLRWSHPSPLANTDRDSPKHFSRCPHFVSVGNLDWPTPWVWSLAEPEKRELREDGVPVLHWKDGTASVMPPGTSVDEVRRRYSLKPK